MNCGSAIASFLNLIQRKHLDDFSIFYSHMYSFAVYRVTRLYLTAACFAPVRAFVIIKIDQYVVKLVFQVRLTLRSILQHFPDHIVSTD